jgi:hypothetical protein
LVELDIFEQISCNFLVVGHTGNECDQTFSILANEFKTEILTLQSLKEKIVNAPILPKPICKSLLYIYDWKNFIGPRLADPPLSNHSKYNSFQIEKENGNVKFRGKLLPQLPDSELVPRPGIRLIKENTVFEPVGVAEFRVESIKFDDIFKGLKKHISKIPLENQMSIMTSWENLRKTLESLPNKSVNFKKLKFDDLPKQKKQQHDVQIPDYLKDTHVVNDLMGDVYEEDILEGDRNEIDIGTDCCIYTDAVRSRPWLGRVTKVLDNRRLEIQWFMKKTGRGHGFQAMINSNGTPNLGVVEVDSVMFWHMTEKRSETEFYLSAYWIEIIKREYETLDQ